MTPFMKSLVLNVSPNFLPFVILNLHFNLEFGGDDFNVKEVEECQMRGFMY